MEIENWFDILDGESSECSDVTSGVGPTTKICSESDTFHNIYSNDLDDGLFCKILKFTDDTKLVKKLRKDNEISQFKEDLSALSL